MKWISHIAISGATTAILAPPLVPFAVLGGVFPDLAEKIGNNFLGMRLEHRKETHYFAYWLFGFGACWSLDLSFLTAFCWGGITHVLADSVTVTGVPFSPLSDRRFHLFGGRLRTGSPAEYMITFCFTAICFALAHFLNRENSGFLPFFYDWAEYFENGLIDGFEWKLNRFRIF